VLLQQRLLETNDGARELPNEGYDELIKEGWRKYAKQYGLRS
jgi:hypothetical protein